MVNTDVVLLINRRRTSQEKVHLHLDKPFYSIGNDIGLKLT
jgi:hypothetical protein